MIASKENARKAYLIFIETTPLPEPGSQLEEELQFVADFLLAVESELPTQATYARKKER